MSLIKVMEDLINKAQGYGPKHSGSGGPAEAVNHDAVKAPSEDEAKKEKNPANSGTHPKGGGTPGSSNNPEGGEDFKTGGAAEDTIETPKGAGGRAPVARPGTIKHEGGGVGPNHPGTATSAEKSEGEADLEKGENPFEKKDDKKEESKDHEESESKEEEKEEEKSEKSSESGEVFLDIDEFAAEMTKSVTANVLDAIAEQYGEVFEKSQQAEYIDAGLAKSLVATLDRVEELEKAIVNIANAMNIRKSLLKSADIKGIDNPSLSKTTLSKSEISSRLLDMQMSGQNGVDTNLVLRFDAVGDTSILPAAVKSKLGID